MSPVYFSYAAAVGALSPYLALYFQSIGLTGTQIGLLLSMQPVLLFVSQPIFGPLADRSGHRGRMLALVLLLSAATGALTGAGNTFWTILPLMALWAFFAGLFMPIADSIALGEMEATGVSFARLRLWGSVGFLIVTIVTGRLYATISLRWMFLIYGVLLLAAVYFAHSLPARGLTTARPIWGELGKLARNPFLVAFLVLCAVEQLTIATNAAFFSMHVKSIGGSNSVVGLAWGMNALVEVPVWLVLGTISRRFGSLPLLAVSALGYALRWWLYSTATSPVGLVWLSLLQSVTYAIFMPTAVVLMGELTPPELRTSGQALLGLMTLGLANLLGMFFGGRIVDRVGTVGLFRIDAGVALVAFAGFLVLVVISRAARRKGAEAGG